MKQRIKDILLGGDAQKRKSLLADQRGIEFFEVLLIVAIFVFVVIFGAKYLGDKTKAKFGEEGNAIEGVQTTLPTPEQSEP